MNSSGPGDPVRRKFVKERDFEMFGQEISSMSFWFVALMICIILLVLVGQLSRFYARMKSLAADLDAQQLAINAQLKQLQGTLSEVLGEIRRGNRLSNELIELKQAELTGDFEIVEEPIAPAPAPARKSNIETPEVKSALPGAGGAPKTFPKL